MGREIRKVAKGWQHPKNENGNYKPQRETFFDDAFNDWLKDRQDFLDGKDESAKKHYSELTTLNFHDWAGGPPEPGYYREVKWTEEEACCFQYYENVSEGTPLSPVFDSLKELEDWLVNEHGHSRHAAQEFCKSGYAPSFTMQAGVIKQGIDSYD